MPRGLHPGRPGAGSDVIPTGWAAAHAPIVEDSFDCTVTIGPAGVSPTFDPGTRQMQTTAAAAVYTGPASVQLLSLAGSNEGRRVVAATDEVDVVSYVVKIPAAAVGPVRVDHVVHVVASPNPALVGRDLVLTKVPRPGRAFSGALTARLHE